MQIANLVGTTLVGVLLFGCLFFWAQAFPRLRTGEPLVPFEPRRPVPWRLVEVLLSLLLWLLLPSLVVLTLLGSAGLQAAEAGQLAPTQQSLVLFAGSIGGLITVLLAGLLVRQVARANWADFGVDLGRLRDDLRLGVRAFFMLAPPVYAIQLLVTQWFESRHPLVERLREQPNLLLLLASWFAAVLVAPLVEEFFIRLLLQGWLEKVAAERSAVTSQAVISYDAGSQAAEAESVEPASLGKGQPLADRGNPYQSPALGSSAPWPSAQTKTLSPQPPSWPIFVSAFVFAMLHFSHGPDPIPLFVLAVGLGYLYRQTHRILPSIVVHLLLNLVSMMMFSLGL